jgi:hypothetical protein
MRRLFFSVKLHALYVFGVINNIRANLINGGLLIIIDFSSLISLNLTISCRFSLSFFFLVLLLILYELL